MTPAREKLHYGWIVRGAVVLIMLAEPLSQTPTPAPTSAHVPAPAA